MKAMNKTITISALTITVLVGLIFGASPISKKQDPVTQTPPDSAMDSIWEQDAVMQVDDRISATVSFDLTEKTVTLNWVYTYLPDGNLKNHARVKQVISTVHWPTSIVALSDSKLLVAGSSATGGTGIQVWEVVPPQVMIPVGSPHIELIPQPIASKTLVFSSSTAGMKDIAWMLPRVDSSGNKLDSVYAQFWDSKDVYIIDLLTGGAQIQVSPTNASAPLLLPEIDQEFNLFTVGMHSSEGFVLMLTRTETTGPTILLIDGDVDGNIEVATILTPALAGSTSLLDGSQYSSY